MTVRKILTTQQSTFDNSVMNVRQFVFEIVVGPNPKDDSVKPLDLLD